MEPDIWHAPPGDEIPNHPSFPVLIYRGVGVADPDVARKLFAAHGWRGCWVDGVFDFHHFHSTSHEVLGRRARGAARRSRRRRGRRPVGGWIASRVLP